MFGMAAVPVSILLLCLGLVSFSASTISPLSIPPSLYWDGADGSWSTFHVEVGTPGQLVRLLPCTSANPGASTWVVIDQGCSLANPNMLNCASRRGGIFQSNVSTSFSTQGLQNGIDGAIYDLDTYEENMLGLAGNGSYGFDTISLGLPGSGLPVLEHQVVTGIWTNNYLLGSLGLSPLPFNFTSVDQPHLSLMGSLINQSLIPSASWSYTAGAFYRDTFGSLTLGGYDQSRFVANNLSIPFGADFSRDLVVSLQSITYDTTGSSPLLASSIDIFIDSLVSELWLPVEVCEAFQKTFNLTWNEQDQVYLVDYIAHTALLAQNPSFTFTIGGQDVGETVDIVLPYAAFDLNLTMPIAENATRYFPLKQAQNATQYTLGRAFLQEAYVMADYERKSFSVAQALFPDTSVPQKLVAIKSPRYHGQASRKLSTAMVVGIALALVSATGLCLVTTFFVRKRRHARERPVKLIDPPSPKELSPAMKFEADGGTTEIFEIGSRPQMLQELPHADSAFSRHELESKETFHEVESREKMQELDGREVSYWMK